MAKKEKDQIGFTMKWVVYATPEKVFDALTNAGKIEAWTHDDAAFNLSKNGEFKMFGDWVSGNVISFEKGKSLSYTWKPVNWNKKAAPSTVNYLFMKHEAGCEVVLEHYGFPDLPESDNHYDGWATNVFEPLNDYFVGL